MSFFDRFRAKTSLAPQAAVNVAGVSYEDALASFSGAALSGSGVSVSRETAMLIPAVLASVRILADTLAALPFNIYKKDGNSVSLAFDHPLQKVLSLKPNYMMTSFVWRQMMMGTALTSGNHYSVIARNLKGEPAFFIPVESEYVTTYKRDGRKYHKIQTSNGIEIWDDEDVLHIPGFGFDGIKGLSAIKNFARECLGQVQATQSHTSAYFKDGASVGSVLETEQKLTPERQKEILDSFKANFVGVKNAKKTALLVDGFKFKGVTVSNEDAQLIETMKFQISDIARIFGVPPHLIGDLEKATFSNIEQQGINFVQYSLLSWVKRIEQEFNSKLFPNGDYFVRFNLDGLLRGDFASRMTGYASGLNAGIYTINEVRGLENLNPIKGGDTLRVPLNMARIDENGFTAIDAGIKSTTGKEA